jgi:ABC-type uncharacterized transport system ATPase subunit
LLRLAHISKTFAATRAVDDTSFAIRGGEIVALAGENGAGKTTLMRIAAGELAADSGSIERDGVVELVHQHFMLVPDFTIAENLALTRRGFRFARPRTIEEEARAAMAASGIELPNVARRVAGLSVGETSKLELIKAISRRPSTLILDEPTSVLTPSESQELFAVMRRLAADGTAIIFISHKLPEVMEVADRIVVMRGGRVVAERPAAETNAAELAAAMVQTVRPQRTPRAPNIRAIVGVAGNGQRELAAKWRDEYPGAAHIPEDRTRDGIVAQMSIAENLALRTRRWLPREAAEHARRVIETYSIRATGPHQLAGSLSGGNQQKVVLARELRGATRIFASEPTRGLDIEATSLVHDHLLEAASEGAEITLITSDLDEAFSLAGTIQVIYRGRLSEPMTPEEARGRVAGLMAGLA